jgi:hypothetical protein
VYAVPVQNAEDESVLWGRGRERKGRPGEEERDLEEEEEEVIGRGGYDVSPPWEGTREKRERRERVRKRERRGEWLRFFTSRFMIHTV